MVPYMMSWLLEINLPCAYIPFLGDCNALPIFNFATDDEVDLSQLVLIIDVGVGKLGYGT
jgi:hypothetical protein